VSDSVFEADFAIKVGLPVEEEKQVILLPAPLGKDFCKGVGNDIGLRRLRRGITGAFVHVGVFEDGAEDFPGGVNNEGVPEVAGNGLVALLALAADGSFDRSGDTVGRFVKKDF